MNTSVQVVLYSASEGYYAGQNKKYWDMFNVCTKKCGAKIFNLESAHDAVVILNAAGYDFVIEKS